MKRRYFVLFEIMVALSLAALMLTMLARFFVGCVRTNHQIEQARSALAARQGIETRLSSVFAAIPLDETGPRLCTSDPMQPTLAAIFDQGIDPDPRFSGRVLSLLFIDGDSNLSLAIWPQDKHAACARKEILCSGVESMQLHFFGRKASCSKPPFFAWRTDWPKNLDSLPAIVRLSLIIKGKPIDFAFTIPSGDSTPVYRLSEEL